MAPSTPPPPSNVVFAALTMASTVSVTILTCRASSLASIPPLAMLLPSFTRRGHHHPIRTRAPLLGQGGVAARPGWSPAALQPFFHLFEAVRAPEGLAIHDEVGRAEH